MSPSQRILHEVVIRALQMVLNAWRKYLDEEIAKDPSHHKSISNRDERPVSSN